MNPDIIFQYFPELSETQKEQFAELGDLYAYWNARINVISRKDFENFYLHHVLHSLAIGKIILFNKNTRIMDAGTGGGFPGIPLAILFSQASFYLVDSIGKKIRVVNEVVSTLRLENVNAEQIRMEQVKGQFDFIVSRAVTVLPEFMNWTQKKIHKTSINSLRNGVLYLKGGDLTDELKAIPHARKKVFDLSDYFKERFFETKKLVHLS
jgi:16S rRNA (guanine527-N7)-methyltransferase